MNIWIFNHYAQPENSPGGTRHYDLAKSLNNLGCKVTIFASSFHYTLLKEILPFFKMSSFENYGGVDFVFLKTIGYKRNGFFRLLNMMSYPISLFFHLVFSKFNRPDLIVGSTVHPFAGLAGCFVSKVLGVPHIFEIRDLWPETFIDMKIWDKKSFLSRFFYKIESFTVRNSSGFLVLSPLTSDYLVKRYNVDVNKILLLPNGVNETFCNRAVDVTDFKSNNSINIKYVGGLDSVHGLDFLIELAVYLPENFIITLVGDGKDKLRLVSKAKRLKLVNVIFLDPVPKNMVPRVLQSADLLFLCTADVFYGSENKLYEYMSSSKPIIVATNALHNNPVKELNCGLTLDRNDALVSSNLLESFVIEKRDEFHEIGARGYDYIINNRTTSSLANKLFNFLNRY